MEDMANQIKSLERALRRSESKPTAQIQQQQSYVESRVSLAEERRAKARAALGRLTSDQD